MRAWLLIVALAGCEKKVDRYEGPLPISFGDCAGETTAFVSGPLPQAFSTGPAAKADATARADDGAPTTETGAFTSLTGTNDDALGGLVGSGAGETNGGFGYGRNGFGPGGRGSGWGTIGTGRYGTIGGGQGGYGIGHGRGRMAVVPTVSVGQPNAQGDLDKAIIRRYIKRNIQKIQYCYEKQLLTKPKIEGTVATQFTIAATGSVTAASASGFDPDVSSCVAEVIKSIEFPKPKGGGIVQVNYPFTFRPAGEAPPTPPPADTTPTPPPAAPTAPTAPPLEPAHTLYRVGRAQPYEAGADNPLRIERDAITECLRGNPAHFGATVVELHYDAKGGVASAVLHGITDETTRDCISEVTRKTVQPKGAPAVQRCAFAFGEQPATDLTTLALTKDGAQLAGKPLSLEALKPELDAAVKAVATSTAVVTTHNPISLRVDPATPMKLVAQAWSAILGAGDDFVFAGLQPVALPAPPVPFSTGGHRARVKSPGHGSGENVVMSVYVTKDHLWVGLSRVNEFQELAAGDLAKLEATLKDHKASAFFADRTDLEIAGDDDVSFGDVSKVIEIAGRVGFSGWTVAEPKDLAARPTL